MCNRGCTAWTAADAMGSRGDGIGPMDCGTIGRGGDVAMTRHRIERGWDAGFAGHIRPMRLVDAGADIHMLTCSRALLWSHLHI